MSLTLEARPETWTPCVAAGAVTPAPERPVTRTPAPSPGPHRRPPGFPLSERFMHARFRLSPALLDIVQSLAYSRAIIYMAMSDLRARYKRSVLGPLWMTLGTAIGAVGLSFLWAELMHKDVREFMPTVTAGLILWQFIDGVVGDASALFSRQAALIRNINLT